MKLQNMGASIVGAVVCMSFCVNFNTAEAACRKVLAPNGWQYITVCDGYRGGANYGGAVAAGVAGAAIAIELLPGVLDSVGGITGSVGEVTSGVAGNLGGVNEPLQNFLSSTNNNTGGQNNGALNPFNIFNQPEENPANKKSAKTDETPSLFPNIFAPQVNTPSPTVNTPHVNAPAPQVNVPTANVPLIPNIFAPQVNTPAPRINTPQVNTPHATVTAPRINSSQP
jgi:hypothetical protein